MPDSAQNGDFSQMLRQLMEKPEISNLIASLKSDTQSTSNADADTASDAPEQPSDGTEETKIEEPQQTMPSLSPDMLAKLPAILSMLSGMGIGTQAADQKTDDSTPGEGTPVSTGDDAQRKALLRALRPYLSPKRRSVVDSMLQLGDLTKLFGTGPRR
ncbi:MAG: hypothetical protein KHW59_02400 [Clostridiales bacterium]|nr:hypothetical protein [Clostridiales bacterium]